MNPYGNKNTAGRVWELIEPKADALGYRLWNVEYVREGADMYLRITIDSDSGITIDDCERFTREIDPLLDEADPIDGSYYLEVSSPGIERVLTTDEHFALMTGSTVEIKLYRPTNGVRTVMGVLVKRDDKYITITSDGAEKLIERSNAAKVTTVYDWRQDMKDNK